MLDTLSILVPFETDFRARVDAVLDFGCVDCQLEEVLESQSQVNSRLKKDKCLALCFPK